MKELERARSEGVDAERLEELEVKAAVNDPEIRWRSENDAGRGELRASYLLVPRTSAGIVLRFTLWLLSGWLREPVFELVRSI